MQATIEKGVLTIRLPVNAEPTPSATGKTLIVATTHGNQVTAATVNGKPVVVGVTAYIRR